METSPNLLYGDVFWVIKDFKIQKFTYVAISPTSFKSNRHILIDGFSMPVQMYEVEFRGLVRYSTFDEAKQALPGILETALNSLRSVSI